MEEYTTSIVIPEEAYAELKASVEAGRPPVGIERPHIFRVVKMVDGHLARVAFFPVALSISEVEGRRAAFWFVLSSEGAWAMNVRDIEPKTIETPFGIFHCEIKSDVGLEKK